MSIRYRGPGIRVVFPKRAILAAAPASASVAMAASVLRDERRMMPCACLLNGEYGIEGLYMGVPAFLGRGGVERILEVPLKNEARSALHRTAGEIQGDVEALRSLGLI